MSENDLATVLEENAVLRREIGRICAKCDEASEKRDAAIIERDEARRWFCRAGERSEKTARAWARKRGWDCFKGETK